MERTPRTPEDGTPPGVPGDGRLWLLPLAGLFVWQGWMTLQLFGPDDPWTGLRDERPILSGRHPLHLYHAHLGARAFLRQGSTSCYDPAFQAGYPKTPVFDGDSRPGEVFLCAVGGEFRPAAYKIGLAVCCMLVPYAFAVAGRGIGLNRRAVFLCTLLGQFVWWGRPCQESLHDGNLDLLLAALSAMVLSGLLIRFDRKPGGRACAGQLVAGFLGWLFHPLLLALLMPLFLIYYLSTGARHRMVWSVLLLGGCFLAVGANYFWLRDWVRYWWLRVPLSPSELLLPHRTFAALWRAPLLGDEFDRCLILLLIGLGCAGATALNQTGRRPAARLFGLGALVMLAVAVGGVLNGELGRLGATNLLVPGMFFAAPLMAHALELSWQLLRAWTGQTWRAASIAALPAVLLVMPEVRAAIEERCTVVRPFVLGLNPAQEQIVETLRQETADTARILWETTPHDPLGSGWTPLLPRLTGRSFIGGLDSEDRIEHTANCLTRQMLAGRPLNEWTDRELADYCRDYNIGWIMCWTRPTAERFLRWTGEKPAAVLGPNGEGILVKLRRPHSFILKGKARWLGTDLSKICLADVQPEDGVVILSLHFQEGLTASPGRVKVTRPEGELRDIPFVVLHVESPVAHLTLVWQK